MTILARRPKDIAAPAPLPDPTDEQAEIIHAVRHSNGNLMINALAGTGKTTTLGMMLASSQKQPALCLAFNRRIADTMIDRLTGPGQTNLVRTFNSLGQSIWYKTVGRIKLDPKKQYEILQDLLKEMGKDDQEDLREDFGDILKAVGLARNLGYVPEGKFPHAKRLTSREKFHASLEEKPGPLMADVIDAILFKSVKGAYEGWIDFDDQVYMPTLFGGSFPRFPLVAIDEVQDLNPINHEMSRKLIVDRLCAVGDPWQSIYAFRGAVQEGMARMQAKFSCEVKDLSISFRCPEVIVKAAQWRVPHFKWMKAGGHHEVLRSLDIHSIPEGATILCRNNAPLFKMAFGLLANQRSVQIAGSDVGPKLVRLLQKIGTEGDDSEALISKIDAWKEEKLAKANPSSTILDQADCLKIFATFGANLDQAVAYAKHLFEQQGTIQLSTGHKAKGLEWDTVYHLNPWLIGDEEQELNLRYVITTRAKNTLFEIDDRDIQW